MPLPIATYRHNMIECSIDISRNHRVLYPTDDFAIFDTIAKIYINRKIS